MTEELKHREVLMRGGKLAPAGAAPIVSRQVAWRWSHKHHKHLYRERGMLLLVVLVILAVLALIAATFSYRMDAERRGVQALGDLQQARLSAESGLSRLLLLLRNDRTNMDMWYNNPDSFRRVPVYMPGDHLPIGGSESPIHKEAVPNQTAWRYSVVAYEKLAEDRVVMRYGLTDEAGKLNINFASRGELLRLVNTMDLGDMPPEALVDCLIDWRDQDSDTNSPAGAETPWYMTMNPSYRAKNRPFDSVDELLMVKNWSGRFLYGEDHNRNGYLDENEDDGEDGAFPPDNGDGILERGLARLMTVYSWDWNFGNDNKPRNDINALDWSKPETLPEHIQEEIGSEVMDFLAQAKERGFKFRSVGELWGLEVYEDGSSNYDDAWDEYRNQVKEENAVPLLEGEEDEDQEEEADEDEDQEGEEDEDEQQDGGMNEDEDSDREGRDGRNDDTADEEEDDESLQDRKNQRLNQSAENEPGPASGRGAGRGRGRSGQDGGGEGDPNRPGQGRGPGIGDGRNDSGDNRAGAGSGDRSGSDSQPEEETEAEKEARRGTPIVSPVSPEQMNVVMDRLTTINQPVRVGQINVNTAPVEVLQCLIGMTQEEAEAIVARRRGMPGPDKITPAWLVTTGTMTPAKFAVLSNKLTARSIQFTADIIGFADHVGTYRRIQAVIEMRGHMAQVRYFRDISSLGIGFPVKDDERSEGLAFGSE